MAPTPASGHRPFAMDADKRSAEAFDDDLFDRTDLKVNAAFVIGHFRDYILRMHVGY